VERTNSRGEDVTTPESASAVRADTTAAPRPAWSGPYLFRSGTGQRPYFVYTPTRYQAGTRVPLVVMLHGCSQTPRGVAVTTRWNELAEERNFIVVYPAQPLAVSPDAITGPPDQPPEQPGHSAATEPPGNQLDPCWQHGNGDNCWNWFLPEHQHRGDGEPAIIAGITHAVIADTTQPTIDPDRVYVAGMSAGAAMAVILGATYPDLYSAVAAHSGLEYQAATTIPGAFQALLQGGPNPADQGQQAFQAMGNHARLMPVLVVQGTSDQRVNPVNGDQVIQQWLHTNRLATGGAFTANFTAPTTDTQFTEATPGGHPYRVRTWTDAQGRPVHEYWTIDGMGHAWSGGFWLGSFADPRGPDATRAMYSFFSRSR
jgi:poly(hydroxyalkanoate) depolymerase family esterase